MAKVIGLGGVFFKSADPAALRAWYQRVLGLEVSDFGAFFPATAVAEHSGAGAVFSPFSETTTCFEPSAHDFMVNLLVDDLDGLLARAKAEGVEPLKPVDEQPYGRFAHIMDPQGRKLELWQPIAAGEGEAGG